jgi:hypothetical protein
MNSYISFIPDLFLNKEKIANVQLQINRSPQNLTLYISKEKNFILYRKR